MTSPLFVAISDIHFNEKTLLLASRSLRAGLFKAEELKIPLVIAGDLHDTKDIIRGKVANELIDILDYAQVRVYILVGNHDKIHEKGTEHGLNYLRPYAEIISHPLDVTIKQSVVTMIPYQTNSDIFKNINKYTGAIVVCHQGFLGANMGDYIQDKTSISPELVKDFTVISGHYHRHQTIGTVTYIGNPYTLSYGEANDGPKGFLVVNSDGTFTREILNFRKHVKLGSTIHTIKDLEISLNPEDLLWLKVTGPISDLKKLNKQEIGQKLLGHANFRLDLISSDSASLEQEQRQNLNQKELFDLIIDTLGESDNQKDYLKGLWRSLI